MYQKIGGNVIATMAAHTVAQQRTRGVAGM